MPRKKRPSRWWWIGTLNGEIWRSLPESPIFPSEQEAAEWARTIGPQVVEDIPPGVALEVREVEIAEVVR